jgi:hypothetical protein
VLINQNVPCTIYIIQKDGQLYQITNNSLKNKTFQNCLINELKMRFLICTLFERLRVTFA